jgi:hypothetical protein
MKALRLLPLLMLSMFLALGCGDDDDNNNPVNGNGGGGGGGGETTTTKGSLSTHSGANAAVTESNVQEVTSLLMGKMHEVFGRAMTTVKYTKPAAPAAGTIMNLDGKVTGNSSGYAQVKGTMTLNQSGMTVSGYTYNFTATYYDFSDDGKIWLGGEVVYTGSADMTNLQATKYDLTFDGVLKFNGTYEGVQDFLTKYTVTGQSFSWNSTITTTSGGKTFSSTSKYPL